MAKKGKKMSAAQKRKLKAGLRKACIAKKSLKKLPPGLCAWALGKKKSKKKGKKAGKGKK